MLLTDIQNEVYSITKRPDKVADTLLAIKAAWFKAHTFDLFSRDIVELGISFPSLSLEQSFTYKALFPLFRAVSYIQPIDGTSFMPVNNPLEQITPNFILDQYNYYKDNVYYEAGSVIQIRTNPGYQYFAIGFYQFPDLTPTSSIQDWITQDFPYAVIYEAASRIFKQIGYTDQVKAMDDLAAIERNMLLGSSLQITGY